MGQPTMTGRHSQIDLPIPMAALPILLPVGKGSLSVRAPEPILTVDPALLYGELGSESGSLDYESTPV